MLTAFCSTSQISLQPSGDGRYCTDTAGVREIARLFKELEYSRAELKVYDHLLIASEMEANAYKQLVDHGDSINEIIQRENADLNLANHSLKKERWFFGGGGVLTGIIIVLLL